MSTHVPLQGEQGGTESGVPALGFAVPGLALGAASEGGLQVGVPLMVFTPPPDRAEPTYYIGPVPDLTVETDAGPQLCHLAVEPGPEYVRVAPHPLRGNNPNVFIRRDDPHAAMAEVLDG